MSEIKLKLCPFCGGEAKLIDSSRRASYVRCSKCCAETNHFEMSVEYCAIEKAAEAWNQRTNELPESTTPIHATNLSAVAWCDKLICSHCGIVLQDWVEVRYDEDMDDTTHHEYVFNYCPNCGAKIEEAEEHETN